MEEWDRRDQVCQKLTEMADQQVIFPRIFFISDILIIIIFNFDFDSIVCIIVFGFA